MMNYCHLRLLILATALICTQKPTAFGQEKIKPPITDHEPVVPLAYRSRCVAYHDFTKLSQAEVTERFADNVDRVDRGVLTTGSGEIKIALEGGSWIGVTVWSDTIDKVFSKDVPNHNPLLRVILEWQRGIRHHFFVYKERHGRVKFIFATSVKRGDAGYGNVISTIRTVSCDVSLSSSSPLIFESHEDAMRVRHGPNTVIAAAYQNVGQLTVSTDTCISCDIASPRSVLQAVQVDADPSQRDVLRKEAAAIRILEQQYTELEDLRKRESIASDELTSKVRELVRRAKPISQRIPQFQLAFSKLQADVYGDISRRDKRYSQFALAAHRAHLRSTETIFGEGHPNCHSAMLAAMSCELQSGSPKAANSISNVGIESAKLYYGTKIPGLFKFYQASGSSFLEMGHISEGIKQFNNSYELAKELRSDVSAIHALNNLASAHIIMGNYGTARGMLLECIRYYEANATPANQYAVAVILNNLGLLAEYEGELEEASRLYGRSVEMREQVLPIGLHDYGTAVANLASLKLTLGEAKDATQLYSNAQQKLSQHYSSGAPEVLSLSVRYADFLYSSGRWEDARVVVQEALAASRKNSREKSEVHGWLTHLGAVIESHSNPEEAARQIDEYLISIQSASTERQKVILQLLASRVTIALQMDDVATASEVAKRAIELATRGFPGDSQALLQARLALTSVELASGNIEGFISEGEKCLPLLSAATFMESLPVAKFLIQQGWYHYRSGNPDTAVNLLTRATKLTVDYLREISVAVDEKERRALANEHRLGLDYLLSVLLDTRQPPHDSLAAIVSWKHRNLLEELEIRRLANDANVRRMFSELRKLAGDRVPTGLGGHLDNAFEVGNVDRYAARRRELEAKIAQFAPGTPFADAEDILNSVIESLGAGEAVIDFFEFAYLTPIPDTPNGVEFVPQIVGHLITRDGVQKRWVVGDSAKVETLVATWRSNYGTSKASLNAANKLRELLWQPGEEVFQEQHIASVRICPDGILAGLAFDALPGNTPGTFLLESYEITYVPSLRLHTVPQHQIPPSENSGRLLVVGGIDYGTPETGDLLFEPLPAAQEEASAVVRAFESLAGQTSDPARMLTAQAATASAVLDELGTHRFIHIATHGFLLPVTSNATSRFRDAMDSWSLKLPTQEKRNQANDVWNRSGLAMANANLSAADNESANILTAEQIVMSPLRDTELVVLSACETGLGVNSGSEGLIGLQTAFHIAGAQSVVASLWKVKDPDAAQFMKLFYENLWVKEMSASEAIRAAKLTMLERYDPISGALRGIGEKPVPLINRNDNTVEERLSPQHWAAFQLSDTLGRPGRNRPK